MNKDTYMDGYWQGVKDAYRLPRLSSALDHDLRSAFNEGRRDEVCQLED